MEVVTKHPLLNLTNELLFKTIINIDSIETKILCYYQI